MISAAALIKQAGSNHLHGPKHTSLLVSRSRQSLLQPQLQLTISFLSINFILILKGLIYVATALLLWQVLPGQIHQKLHYQSLLVSLFLINQVLVKPLAISLASLYLESGNRSSALANSILWTWTDCLARWDLEVNLLPRFKFIDQT